MERVKDGYEITVYGTPGPQGSKRHVGGGRMIESSAKVKPWREAVKTAWLDAHGAGVLLDGPLIVTIIFTLAKPKSAPKTKVTWPDRKPDLDKLLRSTFDALSDAGAWADDARVITVVSSKRYPNEGFGSLPSPGATVQIAPGADRSRLG